MEESHGGGEKEAEGKVKVEVCFLGCVVRVVFSRNNYFQFGDQGDQLLLNPERMKIYLYRGTVRRMKKLSFLHIHY